MSEWSLIYEGFDPVEESLREALCTVGNGYFATRGAGEESHADDVHYPGTYLAGGYNRLQTEIAGRVIENEDLVNMPNWLPLSFRIGDGDWFSMADVELLSYRQELDLKRGVLARSIRFRDSEGRQSRLITFRIVHMADKHIAALQWIFTPENWSGSLEVRTALDGRIVNDGVPRYRRLNNRHLEHLETDQVDDEVIFLKMQTNQSEIRIAQAARTRIYRDGELLNVRRETTKDHSYIAQQFALDVHQGQELCVEKCVSLFTSRDRAISECGLQARTAATRSARFSQLAESHERAWERLWRRFEMDIQPSSDVQDLTRMKVIMRLYVFHLLQSVSPNTVDLDVGVPARGWHGEAYRGHIFWDELFIFPFLNLRMPEITRALLMYRYRRLDEARKNAMKSGYRGALFPWQSGSTGREESQTLHLNPESGRWIPDNSSRQYHINSAIAYNIFQYYQVTDDMEFLYSYGAEMFLEIARFWSSIATYNADRERYEIKGIMGPDEYHDQYLGATEPGLNNNAYTNIMATWVLSEALTILGNLPNDHCRDLRQILGLSDAELHAWDDISRNLFIPFHGDGIISQFEGYEELDEFDWKGAKEKYGDIQRLDRMLEAENDTPNRYKVSKQADVLMLFYLFSAEEINRLFGQLGYELDQEAIPRNIRYYLSRTSHGSTLSRVVHSRVIMRSDRPRSWEMFQQALKSDVADIQGGTTPEGIHLGAMAGTVDLIQRGYTDIEPREEVLRFNPCLPEELAKVCMELRYRSHSLEIAMSTNKLRVTALETTRKPIRIAFREKVFEITPGQSKEISKQGIVTLKG